MSDPAPTHLWPRVSRAFDEVLDLEGSARAARLAALELDDPSVHREVLALLGAARIDTARLAGAAWAGGDGPPAGAPLGSRLGAWELVDRLGEGGMGEVFVARRADGSYEQRAAVKLIRRTLGAGAGRRFLLERQILADLDHPGIARLLDGGVSEHGEPFLVLELVEGRPVTEWADVRGLDLSGRIHLLRAVCEPVRAAHRQLVIHRDLKPTNVLVDGAGRVKLLDFGIAKLLDATTGDTWTQANEAALTPAYAAPEQILGGPVTTATDVFALGVLLYELLTGEKPFPRQARTATGLAKEVADERLELPSARLRRLAVDWPEGRVGLERRARRLRGDLDAIVALALEADRGRRTPTVDELSDDLGRYLAGEPVRARGAARGYRIRKTIARHRLPIGAASLVAATLVLGLTIALGQARKAREEARRAEAATTFLVDLFASLDPGRSRGAAITAREVLDAGAHRLAAGSVDERSTAPLAEAMAKSYLGLGLLDDARVWAERAEEAWARHPEEAAAGRLRGALIRAEADLVGGRLEEARARLEADLPAVAATFGTTSPERLQTEILLDRALGLLGTPGDAVEARRRETVRLAERVWGRDHPRTADALVALSSTLSAAGRYAEAVDVLREARRRCLAGGAERSPEVIRVGAQLGHVLDVSGRDDEALGVYAEVRGVATELLGGRHPQVADVLTSEGLLWLEQGRSAEAEAALEQAAGIYRDLDHFDYGAVLRYLGHLLAGAERFEEALARFVEAEERLEGHLGADHPLVWVARMSRAEAESKLGRLEAAEARLRAVALAQERLHGPASSELRQTAKRLGETLRLAGRPADAIVELERALAIERQLFGTDEHLGVVATKGLLALARLDLGSPSAVAAARLDADAVLAYLRSHPEPARLGRALWTSGRIAAAEGDPRRAQQELREAAALLDSTLGPGAPSSREARSDLDRSLSVAAP